MAAKTHIATAGATHQYGVSGTVTNAVVVSTNITKDFRNTDEVVNESGIAIERRYDDRRSSGTITIRLESGYSAPTVGSMLTYDSVDYELTGIVEAEENEGYVQVTYNILQTEGITPA